MRRFRFWAIGLVSFFSIAAGTILHRVLAVSLCALLGFNSTVCYLGDGDRVNAAVPPERSDVGALIAQGTDIFRNDGGSSQQQQPDIFNNPNQQNPNQPSQDIFAPPNPTTPQIDRPNSSQPTRPQSSNNSLTIEWLYSVYDSPSSREPIFVFPLYTTPDINQSRTSNTKPTEQLETKNFGDLIITTLTEPNEQAIWGGIVDYTNGDEIYILMERHTSVTSMSKVFKSLNLKEQQQNILYVYKQLQLLSLDESEKISKFRHLIGSRIPDNRSGNPNYDRYAREQRYKIYEHQRNHRQKQNALKKPEGILPGKLGKIADKAGNFVEKYVETPYKIGKGLAIGEWCAKNWEKCQKCARDNACQNLLDPTGNLEKLKKLADCQRNPNPSCIKEIISELDPTGIVELADLFKDFRDLNNQRRNDTAQGAPNLRNQFKFPYPEMTGKPPNPGMQSFTWTPDYRLMASNFNSELLAQNLESEFETYAKNLRQKESRNFQKNHVAQFGIPGLPNIPGLPGGTGIIKDAVLTQVVGQLGGFIQNERPFTTSIKDIYPTVSAPPGGEFRPSPANLQVFSQALREANGSPEIQLPPGDYEIPGQVFCFKPRSYGPQTGVGYPLAPIKGKQAAPLIALNSRHIAAGIPHHAAQVLSWNIQLGVKYEDMPPTSRAIVDKILPEFKQQLSRSFWEDLQAKWGQISSTIPGVPSFNSVIGKLPGEVGLILNTYQQARASLEQYRDNFDQLQNEMVLDGNAPSDPSDSKYPRGIWSKINERVYARLLPTTYTGPASMQVRVLDANGNVGQPRNLNSVPQQSTPSRVNNQTPQPNNRPQNPTQPAPGNLW